MSLTRSTVNNSESSLDSEVEYGDDDDDTASVEAHFGDASSSSSASVQDMTASLEECELSAAEHIEMTGSESDDSGSESVSSPQLLTVNSMKTDDSLMSQLPVSVDDSERGYEKCDCLITDSCGLCQSETVLAADNRRDRKVKQMSLRRASVERTARWCAVNVTDSYDVSVTDCLAVNVVNTDTDHTDHDLTTVAQSLTASQCDDNRLACVMSCTDNENCDVAVCSGGRLCNITSGSNDLRAGNGVRVTGEQLSVAEVSSSECQQLSGTGELAATSCVGVNLPLVEDGLSSGHVSDDDAAAAETERACSCTSVDTSSEARCQQRCVELSSSERRCELAVAVEELIAETHSGHTAVVSAATCSSDVTAHTFSDDNRAQPVWVTRFDMLHELHILLVCALLTALSIPYSQITWNSVAGFVCLFVRTVFKMLLLRHFLSD